MGRGRRARCNRLGNGRPSYCGGGRGGRWSRVDRFVAARAETKSYREQEQSFLDLCHMSRSHALK